MEFLVLGATGRTGSAFARQALAGGHRVAALVRAPNAELPSGVESVVGDVLDESKLREVIRAGRVIVVTLSAAAMPEGCPNAIRAATEAGAKRMLGVVGAGVLQADATTLRSELPNYPPPLRKVGALHRAFYEALAASPLDWTLACTPNLVEAPKTGAMRARADYLPDGSGAVTTEDVAGFLLEEAIANRFVRSRVGLNGAPASK